MQTSKTNLVEFWVVSIEHDSDIDCYIFALRTDAVAFRDKQQEQFNSDYLAGKTKPDEERAYAVSHVPAGSGHLTIWQAFPGAETIPWGIPLRMPQSV